VLLEIAHTLGDLEAPGQQLGEPTIKIEVCSRNFAVKSYSDFKQFCDSRRICLTLAHSAPLLSSYRAEFSGRKIFANDEADPHSHRAPEYERR